MRVSPSDGSFIHGQQRDEVGPVIHGWRGVATSCARTENTIERTGCDGTEEGNGGQASITSPVNA